MSVKAGLLLGWSASVVGVSLLVPAYNGSIGSEGTFLLAVWVASVSFGTLAMQARAETSSQALLGGVLASLLPALVVIGGLAAADSDDRGAPLYLWFGLLAAGAWFGLALLSASWDRLKWVTPVGVALSVWTSAVVWFLTYARFD